MDDSKQFHRRSRLLLALFAACLLCFTFLLYDAQVIDQEEYLSRSTTQISRTETVEASRGILTDRNGKVLVSNRQVYTIDFDPALVPKSQTEGVTQGQAVALALLRLLRLCQEHGVDWTDNLPITTSPPFAYTTGQAGDTQRLRLQRYLANRGWSDSELTEASPYPRMSQALLETEGSSTGALSAARLLSLMAEDFDLGEDLSAEEQRLVLGVLYELELRRLGITTTTYLFAEDVSVELISILNDGGFAGVTIGSESVRQYNTAYAAHILGRVGAIYSQEELDALNEPYTAAKAQAEKAGEALDTASLFRYRIDDLVGKEGAEQAFESYLRGVDGQRVITTNEAGKITGELYAKEPQPGGTVALTIDIDFQASVEDALAEAVEAMNAEDGRETRGAAAAVVSVDSSDVLALASYPTYDPATYSQDFNQLNADPSTPFVNRAINGVYAPGSTFKMVTATAALETGVITPTTRIYDAGRYTYWNDYQPACWLYRQSGGSHGRINVSEAIYHSCNYFFYDVGRQVGISVLNEFASAYGLGQRTGIELADSAGILDGPDYRAQAGSLWVGGSVLACAIGQGDSLFTPLQLANYIATLVRGGARYSAHLLHSVRSYDDSQVLCDYQPELVDTVDISDSTLAAIKKGMGDLVTTGSVSRYFADCVVSAGAKTGSVQTGETVANGVFVCFAPFDDPEIAVAIVIEQGGSGAALAATAVKILNAYFADSDIGTAIVPEGSLLP